MKVIIVNMTGFKRPRWCVLVNGALLTGTDGKRRVFTSYTDIPANLRSAS